ncbi:MAG TPA: family 1 glycosylhydrolase [Tepidisphaeraceae bacterium]|jgi:beta-glucosidase/6-phospho-beta-glucosidase/beta-galactosidase
MATPFMFATGIENSYPTVSWQGKTVRRDEMIECGHTKRWKEDFRLVKELGLEYLRYGPPLYSTHRGAGRFDWSFADETFAELRNHNITPIADLCHFGVPDWIGGFDNSDWPPLFAEYAKAFAQRFPWVRLFTPVNEIFVAATFSGLLGWWNQRQTGDRGFITALHQLCKANVMAMRAILEVQPQAKFVQSESSEYFHVDEPAATDLARFFNERRFLSLDLTYGHMINVEMYRYLLANGMTGADYDWFRKNHVKTSCIMGNDYYETNEHLVSADGTVAPSGEIFGYYVITHQYYSRYRLPVMHTETNVKDPAAAPAWLWKEWANMHRLKQDGVPILGFTWYSLTDQIDWDTALREKNGRVNECGLYDLNRQLRPVGRAYQRLVSQWRNILPTESASLAAVQ